MRDPHVLNLVYRLKTDGSVSYRKGSSFEDEMANFRARLEDDVLTVEMKEHHATEESARDSLADYLAAWEIDACLKEGRPSMHFEFVKSETIDRDPPPPGSLLQGSAIIRAGATLSVMGHVVRGAYPVPPATFKASPDVKKMWLRLRQHLEGQEPLLSMAYACLTVIEGSTGLTGKKGARDKAAAMYRIDRDILKTLGELTSTKGAEHDARKFDAGSTGVRLTDKENNWIIEAIKKLIYRKAEYDFNPAAPLTTLSMKDLPDLT